MGILLKIIFIVVIVLLALFVLTLLMYFFNLDMKVAGATQPLINKWYDHYKRKPLP